MIFKWKSAKTNVEPALRLLELSRKLNDGKVEFQGFEYHEWSPVIFNALSFHDELTERDARSIFSQALFLAGSRGSLTQDSLIASLNELGKQHLAQRPTSYSVCTSISLSQVTPPFCVSTGDVQFEFLHHLPSSYSSSHTQATSEAIKTYLPTHLPSDYLFVHAHVMAKSPSFAVEKVLDSLDFIRGIWNLTINRPRGISIVFGRKREPINKILLGPVHTCHKADSTLATENFWYEPDYLWPITPYQIKDERLLGERLSSALQDIAKSPFRDFLTRSLIRYTRALDEYDMNDSVLKLWSLLEGLTFTSTNNYDVTVRRASFLFDDVELTRQTLNYLREMRNTFVHDSKESENSMTCVHQLRPYIETALSFLIRNHYEFSTEDEIARFLDMPTSREDLDTRGTLLIKARKFRKYD